MTGGVHGTGLRIIMLTGDNDKTAKTVADKLGIDEFHAGVQPEDKHERIKALKAAGRKVAMAGDGINDAPALAEPDIGIALATCRKQGRSEENVLANAKQSFHFVAPL